MSSSGGMDWSGGGWGVKQALYINSEWVKNVMKYVFQMNPQGLHSIVVFPSALYPRGCGSFD